MSTGEESQRTVQYVVFVDDARCYLHSFSRETRSHALIDAVCSYWSVARTDCFAIWAVGWDLEIQLGSDDRPCDITENWTLHREQHANKWINTTGAVYLSPVEIRLELRPVALLDIHLERRIKDPVAIEFLYHKAVRDVLCGRYPMAATEAATLAGIQMQVLLGDRSRKHNGALQARNALGRFVPDRVQYAYTDAEWESMIGEEHAAMRGKTADIAMMLYLQSVRLKPSYGSVFFAVRFVLPAGRRRTEGVSHVPAILGVNAVGLHVLETHLVCRSYLFDDVHAWQSVGEECSWQGVTREGEHAVMDTVKLLSSQTGLITVLVNRAMSQRSDEKATLSKQLST